MKFFVLLQGLLWLFMLSSSFPGEPGPKGDLFGKVTEKNLYKPIRGAEVELWPLNLIQKTDSTGLFYFYNLPVGNYSVEVRAPGYLASSRSGVVVVSGRAEELEFHLIRKSPSLNGPLNLKEKKIEGKSSGLKSHGHEAMGTYKLTRSELIRSPGALLDISRTMQFLPGMVRNNDQSTNLIVRGGDPGEVAYLVDGVPIFSINHFEFGRTKRGEIGNINTYFIDRVELHNGGFAARYPDKISGIMDISFKAGDPVHHSGMLLLDAAGTGGLLEGPLPKWDGQQGTYGATFRYSSLELLDKTGVIDFGGVPQYQNTHIKLNQKFQSYDVKVNLMVATDDFKGEPETFPINNTFVPRIVFDTIGNRPVPVDTVLDTANAKRSFTDIETADTQNIFGSAHVSKGWDVSRLTWYGAYNSREEWGRISETLDLLQSDIPYYPSKHIYTNIEESSGNRLLWGADFQKFLSESWTLKSGMYHDYTEVKTTTSDSNQYEFVNGSDYNFPEWENLNPSVFGDKKSRTNSGESYTFSGYAEALFQNRKFDVYSGMRFLYDEFSKDYKIMPRLGLKYHIGNSRIKYAGGLYSQSMAAEHYGIKNMEFRLPESFHNGMGWEMNYKGGFYSAELFQKESYDLMRYSFDDDKPYYGRTISRGVDLFYKYSFKNKMWTQMSYTYAWNREWKDKNWEKTIFSVPHYWTGELGYNWMGSLTTSTRFSTASGSPYLPRRKDPITGNLIYGNRLTERTDTYQRWDLRVDYRKNFSKVSLVTFLEITNVLDKENLFVWFNGKGLNSSWTFFPVGGFSLNF